MQEMRLVELLYLTCARSTTMSVAEILVHHVYSLSTPSARVPSINLSIKQKIYIVSRRKSLYSLVATQAFVSIAFANSIRKPIMWPYQSHMIRRPAASIGGKRPLCILSTSCDSNVIFILYGVVCVVVFAVDLVLNCSS